MANDDGIIFRCHSINNTIIRQGELKILKKYPEKLYFEFGATPTNIKKRYYKDEETLNKDYKEVLALKEEEDKAEKLAKDKNSLESESRKSATKKNDIDNN